MVWLSSLGDQCENTFSVPFFRDFWSFFFDVDKWISTYCFDHSRRRLLLILTWYEINLLSLWLSSHRYLLSLVGYCIHCWHQKFEKGSDLIKKIHAFTYRYCFCIWRKGSCTGSRTRSMLSLILRSVGILDMCTYGTYIIRKRCTKNTTVSDF